MVAYKFCLLLLFVFVSARIRPILLTNELIELISILRWRLTLLLLSFWLTVRADCSIAEADPHHPREGGLTHFGKVIHSNEIV